MAALPKFEQLEQQFRPFDPETARHVVQDAVNLHILGGRQFGLEAGVLKNNTEPAASFILLVLRVQSIELHIAAGRPQQGGQHLDGRRLAGAVRPQKSEDFALLHLK